MQNHSFPIFLANGHHMPVYEFPSTPEMFRQIVTADEMPGSTLRPFYADFNAYGDYLTIVFDAESMMEYNKGAWKEIEEEDEKSENYEELYPKTKHSLLIADMINEFEHPDLLMAYLLDADTSANWKLESYGHFANPVVLVLRARKDIDPRTQAMEYILSQRLLSWNDGDSIVQEVGFRVFAEPKAFMLPVEMNVIINHYQS